MKSRFFYHCSMVAASLAIIFAYVFAANAGVFLSASPSVSHRITQQYGEQLRNLNVESMSIRSSWDEPLNTEYRYAVRDLDGSLRHETFVSGGFITYKFKLALNDGRYKVWTNLDERAQRRAAEDNSTIGPIIGMIAGYIADPTKPLVIDFVAKDIASTD